MIERLAIPGWQTGPTTLEAWVAALVERSGAPVEAVRESSQGSWIEAPSLRLRGYALLAGAEVEAINFELNAPEPGPTTELLDDVAASLGWEIHDDEDDPDDIDDD